MVILLGAEGYELLKKYKIPVAPYLKLTSSSDLRHALDEFGLPLVLKAISPKIIHKTEARAVVICHTRSQARAELARLKKLGYVLAQKYLDGYLTIIGAKADPTFGHVLLFGAGGIYVEAIHDVSFRVCPVSRTNIRTMVRELKTFPILNGARGPKANFKLLERALRATCALAQSENVRELDINPFIISDKIGGAVDVRIIK